MLVDFCGTRCRVSMVNDCRARIVPLSRTKVEIKTLGGAEVTFERPQEAYNISPNSPLEIIGFQP